MCESKLVLKSAVFRLLSCKNLAFHFFFSQSVLSNSEDDSFSMPSHDEGPGEKDWIWVVSVVPPFVLGGLLFGEARPFWVVQSFIDEHVHLDQN